MLHRIVRGNRRKMQTSHEGDSKKKGHHMKVILEKSIYHMKVLQETKSRDYMKVIPEKADIT